MKPPLLRDLLVRATAVLTLLAFTATVVADPAGGPPWWYHEDASKRVIDPDADEENRAVANIGQAKWMAIRALEEFEQELPGPAGVVRARLLGTATSPGIFSPEAPGTDAERAAQKAPLLLGQLKNIAQPFYDELDVHAPSWSHNRRVANGTANPGSAKYPWDEASPAELNHCVANLGQLKAVFALDFHLDQDDDGFTDLREEALALVDEDGDGVSDGVDRFPRDRFNGIPPLLLITGEWTIQVRDGEGPLEGIQLEFRRWAAEAVEPESAVLSEGITSEDGSFTFPSTSISTGDRVEVSLKGSDGQKVYLPVRNGAVAGQEPSVNRGEGLAISSLTRFPDGAGLGLTPDLLGKPGVNGPDPEDPGPNSTPPSYRLCDLASYSWEHQTGDFLTSGSVSAVLGSGQSLKEEGPFSGMFPSHEAFKPIYRSEWYYSHVGDDVAIWENPYSLQIHAAISAQHEGPLQIQANFLDAALGVPARFFASDEYTLNLRDGGETFNGARPSINQNLRDLLMGEANEDRNETGAGQSGYQTMLILGPVAANVPAGVLVGGALSNPFYFNSLGMVELGVELPGEYVSKVIVGESASGALEERDAKIRWTARILEGGNLADVRITDDLLLGSSGEESGEPLADGAELIVPSPAVKLTFSREQAAGSPDPYVGDLVAVEIQAEAIIPTGYHDDTSPPFRKHLGSCFVNLVKTGVVSVEASAAAGDGSLEQSGQLAGAVSGSGDGPAFESDGFVGGQRIQTLEEERRISLSGEPSTDGRSFVDALTRRFHHSETDFSLRIPGSDLYLAVTRNSSESRWTMAHGMRPEENPALAFGPAWHSNLSAGVLRTFGEPRKGLSIGAPQPPVRSKVSVTDYTGKQYSFLEVGVGAQSSFVPDPTMLPDVACSNISLTVETGPGDLRELVLRQPNLGITHRYQACGQNFRLPGNRDLPSVSGDIRYEYSRLVSVSDRFGTTLKYDYGADGKKLIPIRIYVEGRDALQIQLQQGTGALAGRVVAFWDPSGIRHGYHYDLEPSAGRLVLADVTVGTTKVSSYSYFFYKEPDPRPTAMLMPLLGFPGQYYRIDTYHLALDGVGAGDLPMTTIAYQPSSTRKAYSGLAAQYYTVAGDPLCVAGITLPGFARQVIISGNHELRPAAGELPEVKQQKTTVTDVGGSHWEYEWAAPQVLPWSVRMEHASDGLPRASSLFYPSMTRKCLEVPHSEMTFKYDKYSGFSLEEASDAANRKVVRGYRQRALGSPHPLYSPRIDEVRGIGPVAIGGMTNAPTSVLDDEGRLTNIVYTGGWRPRYVEDHRGRVLETVYGQYSRPTNVKLWRSQTSDESFDGLLWEYTLGYHPSIPGVVVRKTQEATGLLASDDPEWVTSLTETIQIDAAGVGWPERTGFDLDGDGLLQGNGDVYAISVRDPSGRVIEESAPSNARRTTVYNEAGLPTFRYLENGGFFSFQYDAAGRMVIKSDTLGNREGWAFDAIGRVKTTVRDLNGNLQFNVSTQTLEGVDQGVDVVSSADFFDEVGEVRITRPTGHIEVAKVDPLRRITEIVKPRWDRAPGHLPSPAAGDCVTSYAYDLLASSEGPEVVTDALGYETRFIYDNFGRVQQVLRQYGNDPQFGRLYQGTRYHYEAGGLVDRTTVARTPLDAVGLPIGGGGMQEFSTRIDYDELDRPRTTTQAEATSREVIRRVSYTSTGLPWLSEIRCKIGASGEPDQWVATELHYDPAGRVTEQILPEVTNAATGQIGRPRTSIAYNANGQVSQIRDASSRPIATYGYDVAGNVSYLLQGRARDERTRLLSEPLTRYRYDLMGRLVAVVDPMDETWTNAWDAAGRLERSETPAVGFVGSEERVSAVQHYSYNPDGSLRWMIDPKGVRKDFAYDANGFLRTTSMSVTDVDPVLGAQSSNLTETWERDALGQVIRVVDGKGQSTGFAYDGLGRLVSRTWDVGDPRSKASSTYYDGLLPVSATNAKGQQFQYLYDERFNLRQLLVPGSSSENIDFWYDDLGRLTTTTPAPSWSGIGYPGISRAYDSLGRIRSETSNGIEHSFGYNLNGDLCLLASSASGRVIRMKHDSNGRVVEASEEDSGNYTVTTFGYDRSGRVVREGMANGLAQYTDYDAAGRIENTRLTTEKKQVICRTDYEYDLNSNVTTQLESTKPFEIPDRVLSMQYDERNRLIREEQSGAGLPPVLESYRYDLADNRISSYRSAGSGSSLERSERLYEYGAPGTSFNSNQLVSYSQRETVNGVFQPFSTTHFEYDANGNRTRSENQQRRLDFGYDSLDRLQSLDVIASGETSKACLYSYDHMSRRIGRKETGVDDRLFSFQGSSPVREWTPAPNGGAELASVENVGGGVGGRLYSREGSSLTFDFHDARGDLVAQATEGSSVSYRALFDSKGDQVLSLGVRSGGYGTNSKWEEPCGLVNDGLRYRDRDTGTFLSRDPAGFADGLNVYNYCSHNPRTLFDPNGLTALASTENGAAGPPSECNVPPGWTQPDDKDLVGFGQYWETEDGEEYIQYENSGLPGRPRMEMHNGELCVFAMRYRANWLSKFGIWLSHDLESAGWEPLRLHPQFAPPPPPPVVTASGGDMKKGALNSVEDILEALRQGSENPLLGVVMGASRVMLEGGSMLLTGPEEILLAGAGKAALALGAGRLLAAVGNFASRRVLPALGKIFVGKAGAAAAARTGPGLFGRVIERMSDRAAIYQSKITGTLPDVGYIVDGVKFDGFNGARAVLLDAKGAGYAFAVKNGQFLPWYKGADKLVSQAQRQVGVAGGTPIEWHFAEETAASATRNLLRSRGIEGISIIYTP
jgi:RHS repeat-associated protein